jgi:hypothetical protein
MVAHPPSSTHAVLDGEKAIAFVIACLILLGMLVFIAYTVSMKKKASFKLFMQTLLSGTWIVSIAFKYD